MQNTTGTKDRPWLGVFAILAAMVMNILDSTIVNPVIGLSTILGPVIAGLLIDADVLGTGRRMVFLINVPLGAFCLIAGLRALPRGTAAGTLRLDVVVALVAGLGMFLLVDPLVQGREQGSPCPWDCSSNSAPASARSGRASPGVAPLPADGPVRQRDGHDLRAAVRHRDG